MEPASLERLLRRRRIPVVPGHHGRAAVHNLADVTLRDIVAVIIDDPDLDVNGRFSDRSHLPDRVLRLEKRRVRGHLGLSEGVDDADIRERRGQQLKRRPRSS